MKFIQVANGDFINLNNVSEFYLGGEGCISVKWNDGSQDYSYESFINLPDNVFPFKLTIQDRQHLSYLALRYVFSTTDSVIANGLVCAHIFEQFSAMNKGREDEKTTN